MDIRDRRALKTAAGHSLANAAYDPKKLILIHTGAILLLSLVLTVVDYLLEKGIGTTGGLSGMGMRSVLETAQTVLRYGQAIALPFWQTGYLFVTVKLARGEQTGPQDLTEGFRRFGPVLRLQFCMGFVYFGIGMACSYISSVVFMLTPFSGPVMEQLLPIMNDAALMEDPAALENAMMAAMESMLVPLLAIFLVTFLALGGPVFYRLRMAERCLLDAPGEGAFHAIRKSMRLMKGSCLDMLKLDLSFWWFYLLDALVTVVAYGDLILTALGIETGLSTEITYFGFFALYLLCQLGLYWWRRNQVEVTYSHAYNTLLGPRQPKPEPQPGSQPWTY